LFLKLNINNLLVELSLKTKAVTLFSLNLTGRHFKNNTKGELQVTGTINIQYN